ncbi:Beta-barrel assembly-enhancing protease [Halioglobus japonicus]|nr:Beta-barrel assembly-enhancing protease [Halioglobus japonicus]
MRKEFNEVKQDERVPYDGAQDWPEPPNYQGLKRGLLVILIAAVGTAAVMGLNHVIPKDHRARAAQFLAEKDYASAVTALKHVLRDSPSDGEVRWTLGETYLQMGQKADALNYMQEAFDLNYRSPDLVLALARSKLLARNYQGVLALYEDWGRVDTDTDAATWEALRGRALLDMGQREDAVEAFLQALRRNPGNNDAKRGLVESELGADLAGLSDKDIQRVLAAGLDQPETWVLRGELALSRGNLEEARTSFEKAVALGPDNVFALAGLVRSLIASDQLDDAREPVMLLAKKFPNDPMSAYVRALYAKQSEQYVQALDALKVVLDYEPDHAMSLLLMGEVYFEMDNHTQAMEYLKLFHHHKPDSVLGRRQLAAILNQQGSHKQAIELLEPLLEQSRHDPEIVAILASSYTAMGDEQRAKGYQSLFFKLGSVNSAARVALGYINSGDTEEGISKLDQLVEDAPEKVETQIMLTVSLLRAGEYDKAQSISTALLEERPKDPQVLYLHGSVLELSGDLVGAGELYERALTLAPKFSMAELALARIDMSNDKPKAAKKRINKLLEKDPDNTTAQLWLVQLALGEGNYEDAIARLEDISAANKKILQPRLILADLYLQQGKADSALHVSREIVKLVPDHPVGNYLLASAQILGGEIDEGLAILDELETSNPDDLHTKWQVVDAQEAKGNQEAVYEALQRILAVDPNSPRALLKLAMMERLQGDENAAITLANQFTLSHPESGMGYMVEAQILMDNKQYLPAAELLSKAFSLNNDSISLSRYFIALTRAGEVNKAEKAMSDWLAANPEDSIARLAWADEISRRGDTARAVKQYELVARHEPENLAVLVRLASGYHELGDRRDLKTAQEAYELDPEDLYAKHLYGWLLAETGLGDQGTQMLREVVALAPDNVTFRVHLATALADNGLEDDARAVLHPLVYSDTPLAEPPPPEVTALMDRLNKEQ